MHRVQVSQVLARSYRFVAASLLLAALTLAAPRAQAAEVIPSLGMTRTPTSGDNTRLSYGVAVRGSIAPMLSAELGVGYRKDVLLSGSVESTQWPITASLWAKPLPMFYVGGGAGWYNTTLKYPQAPALTSETTQKFGVHLGGGITMPMVPGIASLDLNGRYVYLGDQASQLPPNNYKADFWTTSLGVALHF